jgi:hypothetical protein
MLKKYSLATLLVCCLVATGSGCSQPVLIQNARSPVTQIDVTPQTEPERVAPLAKAEAKPTDSETVDSRAVSKTEVNEVEAVKRPQSVSRHPGLLDPSLASETAPAEFKATFNTTQGAFVVQMTRHWAPRGADRFYNLVQTGYFNDAAFFRNVKGFMVQFGINGNPEISAKW